MFPKAIEEAGIPSNLRKVIMTNLKTLVAVFATKKSKEVCNPRGLKKAEDQRNDRRAKSQDTERYEKLIGQVQNRDRSPLLSNLSFSP